MRRLVVALLIVGAVAGCGHRPPLEDEPGWDCSTHGNQICGKVVWA